MLQAAEITIQYINQPEGKGPGSIKDTEGRYWRIWPNKIAAFQGMEGSTVVVNYEVGEFRGKPQYTILGLAGGQGPQIRAPRPPQQRAAAPRPAPATPPMTASYINPAEKDENIAVLALVKEWMDKITVGDVAGLTHALKTCRAAWREFKKSHAALAQPPKLTTSEELNDEIPEFDESSGRTIEETY